MSIPEALAYVAAGTSSVAAIAAAVSARTNPRSVRRANLPLVYGEPGYPPHSVYDERAGQEPEPPYHSLFTASTLATLTPILQHDFFGVFRQPWMRTDYEPPSGPFYQA